MSFVARFAPTSLTTEQYDESIRRLRAGVGFPPDGLDPKVVSEWLGHSSIAITMDTYSHALPTVEESAAELMDAEILGLRVEDR
jgi:integrase